MSAESQEGVHKKLQWFVSKSTESGVISAFMRLFEVVLENNDQLRAIVAVALQESMGCPEPTPEEWVDRITELSGHSFESEISRSLAIGTVTQMYSGSQGIPGNPGAWWKCAVTAIGKCAPLTSEDWLPICERALEDKAAIPGFRMLIDIGLKLLQPSIDAGLISIDIHQLADTNPAQCLAYLFAWITEFLRLVTLAFPMAHEVATFSKVNLLRHTGLDDDTNTTVGIWQQNHPVWRGHSTHTESSPHPFEHLLNGGKSPIKGFPSILVQIDKAGHLQLRSAEYKMTSSETQSNPLNVHSADGIPSWIAETRTLKLQSKTVRQYAPQVGKDVLDILNSFQECKWKSRIDDPISPPDSERTKLALRTINLTLEGLKFSKDGDGIKWEVIPN